MDAACFVALSHHSSTPWMVLWTGRALRATTKWKRESRCKCQASRQDFPAKAPLTGCTQNRATLDLTVGSDSWVGLRKNSFLKHDASI